MNRPRPSLLLTATLAAAFPLCAADVIKDNNTDALSLGSSWLDAPGPFDVIPGEFDIAVWNATVTGANASALGGNADWLGIRVADPAGAITVTHAAGENLTLRTAGIDLSSATQDLNLLSSADTAGTVAIATNQTWNVAAGRTLKLFATSNKQNQALTGSGNIEITGGGVVRLLTGDAGSTTFAAGNANDTFTGNWTVTSGTLRGLRNGTHAFGQGTITLNGGTIGQEQGNWTWANPIILATGTTSTFDDFNTNSSTRTLKLQGVLSGDGNVIFNDSSNRMDANSGFILAGANTLSGTLTIGPSGNVRVGGVTGANNTLTAGPSGSLGTASVNLSDATAALTFSRSDAHTVGNPISGPGSVNVGGSFANDEGQVLTLSGVNTYAGPTTVQAGRLHLTGTLTSAITVNATASLSGTGSTTELLTLNAGATVVLAGGGSTTSLVANGLNVAATAAVDFLSAPVAAAVYDVATYGAGGVTNFPGLTANARGVLTDNTGAQKIQFTAAGPQSRTWNGSTGNWVIGDSTNLWLEGDQDFFNWDSVTFPEPAALATVTLPASVTVASLTISNTANAYLLDGAGVISGPGGLTKTGAGALTLGNKGHRFTGNATISGGIVNTGATMGDGVGGYFGAVNGSRTLTIENVGTVVNFNANNQFGGSGKSPSGIPSVVVNAATLQATRFNILGHVTLQNGATLTQSSTDNGAYNGYEFIGGTVTVSGTGTSSITTGNGKANHLAGGRTTTFDVADTTGDASPDLLVTAPLRDGSGDYSGSANAFGVGSLTKMGAGTMTLTGANTYTGPTTVNGGTLALVGGSQTSPIIVNSAGSLGFALDSPTTSTATVDFTAGARVAITGTAAAPTVYTLLTTTAAITGSPVLHPAVPGYELAVTGGNTLVLQPAGGSGYSAWAAANGTAGSIDQDHDRDGVANGVEYFLGGSTNTTGFTVLPGVVNNAGTLSVTWTKAAGYTGTYGTHFTVQTSTTLAGPWTDEPGGGSVTLSGNDLTFTFPAAGPPKKFARLNVTGP
ncbi:MAG: autotransporter-associated beta strand repeat-containing protein [Verrucomicrobiales bacterium]|nr:autotransporter-associated beta strand repeat-containing protein [Verrucomicrobiales bacterium]